MKGITCFYIFLTTVKNWLWSQQFSKYATYCPYIYEERKASFCTHLLYFFGCNSWVKSQLTHKNTFQYSNIQNTISVLRKHIYDTWTDDYHTIHWKLNKKTFTYTFPNEDKLRKLNLVSNEFTLYIGKSLPNHYSIDNRLLKYDRLKQYHHEV